MPKRTPGSLNAPPPQAEFDQVPLRRLTCGVSGTFLRLHSLDVTTGQPWGPLHFSRQATTRFDPANGVGTLYVGESLAGVVMEVFNDRWGAMGSPTRHLLASRLATHFVTRVNLPRIEVLDATGANLSKIGTDGQLLTGDYPTTREWALRLMQHPDGIGGILYRSRHDPGTLNVAIFERPGLRPGHYDPGLDPAGAGDWRRDPAHGAALVHGPAVVLGAHPGLADALRKLEVAILP